MTWEAIGAVAGLLGTVGTVIGLVFVYRELSGSLAKSMIFWQQARH